MLKDLDRRQHEIIEALTDTNSNSLATRGDKELLYEPSCLLLATTICNGDPKQRTPRIRQEYNRNTRASRYIPISYSIPAVPYFGVPTSLPVSPKASKSLYFSNTPQIIQGFKLWFMVYSLSKDFWKLGVDGV